MTRQLLTLSVLVLGGMNIAHAEPGKTYVNVFPGQGDSIDEDAQPLVVQSRKLITVWQDSSELGLATPNIDSSIIFMHRCGSANPCTVQRAGSNSSTASPDRSTIIGVSQGTLGAFSRGDTVWNNTMQCMHEVFSPFGVTITDQDPGSQPHYEIMVGGSPTQLGFDSGVGGVSPATCGTIPSSLVFVFDVWGNNYNEICATAAQEMAHSWSLDHEADASDPMTYYSYNGRRHFKDAPVRCGSDCSNGSAYGIQCGGTNNQERNCVCGGSTQNSVQKIKGLFGDGTPTPPTVTIDNPKNGDSVSPGFPVSATITDDAGVTKAELYVDGQLVQSLTTKPYAFNAPMDLGEGNHMVKVTGYDIANTPASQTISVTIGEPCGKPSDCPNDTDTCIGGRCVPGPGVQGGLGTTCSDGSECASGQCAHTADGSYCVEPCNLGGGECPSGFGCADTGLDDGTGVCFPGYSDGGCNTGNGPGGPITVGLGFAALVFVRRRKRN